MLQLVGKSDYTSKKTQVNLYMIRLAGWLKHCIFLCLSLAPDAEERRMLDDGMHA